MTRRILAVLAVCSLLAVPAAIWAAPVDPVPPPEKPEKPRLETDKDGFVVAKTKGYDPNANVITVTIAETDYALPLKEGYSFTYANGRQVPEAVKSRLIARANREVRLKVEMVDGKETISEIQLGAVKRVVPVNPPIKILPVPAPAPVPPPADADPNAPADKKEEPAPLKGQLKKVDAEKRIIVVEIDGKEREIQLEEKTKIIGPAGREIADGLKAKTFENLRNIQVEIITEKKDGKEVVTEVKILRRAIRPLPIQPNPIQIRPIQIRPIQIQPLPVQPMRPVPVEPEK